MSSQAKNIIRFIQDNNLILVHHNADPDAVGAAQGVKEICEKTKPGSTTKIVLPEGPSRLSKKIIQELGIEIAEIKSSESFDTIFILDTGSLNQLEQWKEYVLKAEAEIVVVDHHTYNEDLKDLASFYVSDENATSTSEIIYTIIKEQNWVPSIKTAKALLTGILFDTKHLSIGDSGTFRVVSELLEISGSIVEIKRLLSSVMYPSEKIARLKAAQRTEIEVINGWIVAFSQLGSFQASAARALLALGADVAVVSGKDSGTLKSSIRSTGSFWLETQLDFGEVMREISVRLDGSGSGHPTAAGYNGSGELDELHSEILSLIRKHLENIEV